MKTPGFAAASFILAATMVAGAALGYLGISVLPHMPQRAHNIDSLQADSVISAGGEQAAPAGSRAGRLQRTAQERTGIHAAAVEGNTGDAPPVPAFGASYLIADCFHPVDTAASLVLQEIFPAKAFYSKGFHPIAAAETQEELHHSAVVHPRLGPAPESLHFTSSLSSFNWEQLGTDSGPTLLIIGGIQGDEPGGFSAAALISTQYRITSGSVWVVPDLNFASIVKRSRGLFGDMNRKFAHLDPKDPEFAIVERVKSILLDDRVDLILNLHDGSGFYRPTHEGPLHNPNRWGQSVIIDQEEMDHPHFGSLHAMARTAAEEANKALLRPGHKYHIHNTHTQLGDKEMEKSLSWFAVRSGKPAFGVEASKEFGTEQRAYYHVLIIESFMRQMGIEFERRFELSPSGVLAALNSDLMLSAFGNRLLLPLDDARSSLANLPFKKGSEPEVRSTKPLLTLVRDKSEWRVAYGNRTLTKVTPAFMDFDESLETVDMLLDGEAYTFNIGEMVSVKESFMVRHMEGYRVNAIGARKEINGTEAEVLLVKEDFLPRYSVDKGATTFRVEIYKGKAFAGMILVRFGDGPPASGDPLTATVGPESDLGF